MKWTTKVPKKPGWYWFKNAYNDEESPYKQKSMGPWVIPVFYYHGRLVANTGYDNPNLPVDEPPMTYHNYWSSRLTEPT